MSGSAETTLLDPRLSVEESTLMSILLDRDTPVGARAAARFLGNDGIEVSEATVSRIFARLDAAGLTAPVGRKGRVLSVAGRRMAQSAAIAERRNEDLDRALEIRSVEQLLDLLRARRGVERELARAAARHCTPAAADELENVINEHREVIATGSNPHNRAMNFHRSIAEMSNNALLAAISDTLWNDSLIPLEKILDIVTVGHGTVEHSVPEHLEILTHIRDGNEDAAEAAMASHLGRLIVEVEDFAASDFSDIFSRLISSIDA
ncbi:FCD domain-containing protein [Pseudoclavibacter terrae]|uniref:FCD domain-containing protein n=1 Tax=Pseudoclavibacter terrae TaxID=1530195 RepID=UPI00232D7C87|nr:FCD domain-containing protein [Pseudoclavibacter terrae]